jgi:hypothetical protein
VEVLGKNKNHKSRNCKYFQNIGFHGSLLFRLNIEFTPISRDTCQQGLHYVMGGYKSLDYKWLLLDSAFSGLGAIWNSKAGYDS